VAVEERGRWKSRVGFILAAAGSAVGLGNIWKFPYITGENGGGLFVLIYLVCVAVVGVPIMMAEIMIGRAAQKQPVAAFRELQGGQTAWAGIGWLGVIAGFVILSYYIVVAGWAMDYTLKSVVNFTGPIHQEAEQEALIYRASTSLEEMRAELAAQRADREIRGDVVDLRNSVRPSVWEGYERYQAAVEATGAEVARRLLEDDEVLRRQVEQAREVETQIATVRAIALEAAQQHYAESSDAEVRDEAEDVARRGVVLERVRDAFLTMASDGWTSAFWSALFMVLVVLIVAGGIGGGIERACGILMPMLFVLIVAMVLFATTQAGFGEALSFVFKPDATRLKASGVLEALGHAFFTLSLGMGAMITYGSYQDRKEGLAAQSLAIAGLDTAVALLACLMIFPITFTYGQEPAAGPGLVFMSMPLAFSEIGAGGMLLAILFFGLVVVAALTSAISLLEVVVSYFIDERGWKRTRAAYLLGGVVFLFGLPSAFSLDPDFAMSGWEPSFGKNFFDTMDYLASNWMLPMGGLLVAIYAGWVMPKRLRRVELEGATPVVIFGFIWLIRVVAPALVVLVLLQKVGLIDVNEILP
jgi:NSS family neurotransmitter:Na+ symporter